ncbi:MAG: radical SAM protein [Candidatus Coproplasma sp.]
MYYVLNKNIALRSWRLVPYAYYVRHDRTAHGLKREEFELLSLCDGLHEIAESELTKNLERRGMIFPVQRGEETLTDWQKPLVCDNRYMPSMNWMITGRCNYNCLHCFNAKDNAPLQSEWSLEEANALLDEAQKCGINGFTITGGEPMAHKHFFEILQGIYSRGMYVFELNTNGFYIDQTALDKFKQIGCYPLIKISFDGFGYHDWMRNRVGAEEDAIRAIKLCIENGFRVMVQTNINRKNKDSILKSLEYLDSLGVERTRVICTTESTRWAENAAGQSFTVPEYYEACLKIAEGYIKNSHGMEVVFWQFLTLSPKSSTFTLTPAAGCLDRYRESRPLCQGNRGMIAVAANGEVYPCMQMSGWMEAHKISFGNVKKDGLQSILQSGVYMDEVCATIGDMLKVNKKCAECPHLTYCRGGCRALGGLTHNGDLRAPDLWKCFFFENGYDKKCEQALAPYKNLTKIG